MGTFSHRTLNFGRLQSQCFISGQRQNVITFSQKQGIIHRIRFSLAPSHLGKKERPSLLGERVHLLGYSQGRQVIRKKPKGFAQSMHWQSYMKNPRIRRKHSCERGFDISEKMISGYMDMVSKHALVILFVINSSLQYSH